MKGGSGFRPVLSTIAFLVTSSSWLSAQDLSKTIVGSFAPQAWMHTIHDASKDPSYLPTFHKVLDHPRFKSIPTTLRNAGLKIDDGGVVALRDSSKQVFSTILRNDDGRFVSTTEKGELVGTFLAVSDNGNAVLSRISLDTNSKSPRQLSFTDLTGNSGIEFDFQTGSVYHLGPKPESSTSSNSGYWSCVINNIASQFTSCNLAFLTAQIRLCYVAALGSLTPVSPISDLLTISDCASVLIQLGQVLFCAGDDCGVSALAGGSGGNFSLTVTPSSRVIVQGQSATYTITANYTGGFQGAVNGFSVSNLFGGASATFSASQITVSGGSTTLNIATTASTEVGDRVLMISASGGGGLVQTVGVELNINPQFSGGATSLTSGQSVSASLSQGQQNNYKVAVPAGSSQLGVAMTGVVGDSDLYVKYGSPPTLSSFDCRPYQLAGVSEFCSFGNPNSGDWFIMVNGYSNSSSYTLTPTYTSSGGGSTALQINTISPTTVPVGVNNAFTIGGSGFQQGFSGTLWVGSNSFPLTGGQTSFINSSQVQLIVKVGAPADPTTAFCLQVTNPGGATSNKFCGLTAQAGGGGAVPNLQISFSPNPVPHSSDGKWYYTVTITETNGVGVLLTSMAFAGTDYSQDISNWFGANQIPAYGHLSSNSITSGNSGNWAWTFGGDSLIWSQSVTLQP